MSKIKLKDWHAFTVVLTQTVLVQGREFVDLQRDHGMNAARLRFCLTPDMQFIPSAGHISQAVPGTIPRGFRFYVLRDSVFCFAFDKYKQVSRIYCRRHDTIEEIVPSIGAAFAVAERFKWDKYERNLPDESASATTRRAQNDPWRLLTPAQLIFDEYHT